jgi:hypothetical protein
MIGRGLDPTAVSVPEVGHVELGREAYEAALAGYRGGDPGDIARWVVHCADAVVLGAREGVASASPCSAAPDRRTAVMESTT